jgi:hypothetical protein
MGTRDRVTGVLVSDGTLDPRTGINESTSGRLRSFGRRTAGKGLDAFGPSLALLGCEIGLA